MALTINIITMYMVHTVKEKNTKQKQKTLLHYNNLCTRLLYQTSNIRAYNCSKNASKKNIQRLSTHN